MLETLEFLLGLMVSAGITAACVLFVVLMVKIVETDKEARKYPKRVINSTPKTFVKTRR